MATTVDFTSSILAMRQKLTKPLLIVTVVSFVAGFFSYWLMGLAVILLLFVTFINGLYVVMPGNAGYKITMGKMSNCSFNSGFGWMIPFISSMTEVDVKRQTHEKKNTMKNLNRRDITLTYVFTWNLNPDEVHTLHATIGESDYIEKALCPQLDACMTNIIAAKTYEDINGHLSELADEVMDAYEPLYDHNLFQNVQLNIIDVKFDADYEKAVSEAAKVEMEKKVVELQAEQLKISAQAKADAAAITAEGDAKAIKIKAEAEAEALKAKGASENEVREKLGEILKNHPELIREVLAKNFPKVYGGGATPMINLDSILGS